MRKTFSIAAWVTLLCLMLPANASAMVVGQARGDLVNGWFKDKFTVDIKYGTDPCGGIGTDYYYEFVAGAKYDGVHTYTFLGDAVDNPYLSLDGESAQSLITPLRCPPPTNGGFGGSGSYSSSTQPVSYRLDALAPTVSITSPSTGSSTTASSISVSGTVNDSASGVASVRISVNGSSSTNASLNGTTFTATVPLALGTNSIQAIAHDNVGHKGTSNTVSVTRNSTTNTSTGNQTPAPTGTNPTSATNPATATPATNTSHDGSVLDRAADPLRFNQKGYLSLEGYDERSADPENSLAEQGLGGAKGGAFAGLVAAVLSLLALAIFIIWRFLPIFKKLDKSNSGLRRRIVLIVALPSLVPLLGLGFLGYQQLTDIVKSSLSSQLARATQVTALKLEREFTMRESMIVKTGDNIIQIDKQVKQREEKLRQQKDACAAQVRKLIPQQKYREVIDSEPCLPFLAGFAQLTGSSGKSVNDYLSAVNGGYDHAISASAAERQQRITELLGSIRYFFPETLELVIVDDKGPVATLPSTDKADKTIAAAHSELIELSRQESAALLNDSAKPRQFLVTYPIINSAKQKTGGVVAKYNLDDSRFIGTIWQSTPKPAPDDAVVIFNSEGQAIYPSGAYGMPAAELKKLAKKTPAEAAEITVKDTDLVLRSRAVDNSNWHVAVATPADAVMAPLTGIQRTALLAIAGFILISVLLGLLFVTGIAKEIERLLAGALAFAKGNLEYRIDLSSKDELQLLGDTMNKMATGIKDAQNALIEKDKEFINVATHELRTPMTGIIGSLSMITEDGIGQVDEKARGLVNQAYSGALRLRDIVNDLLDVARLEAGREEFKTEAVDLTVLETTIIGIQNATAEQHSITLKGYDGPALPEVLADKNKVQMIISNLVSNAVKYNQPGGSVTINHEVKDGMVITSVADTGLGIPAEQQEHIFQKFYRVDHEDRSTIPGTGLGLHITKRFVEAMGGKIWFESVHGSGTTFSFSLPVNQPAPQPAVSEAPVPAATTV